MTRSLPKALLLLTLLGVYGAVFSAPQDRGAKGRLDDVLEVEARLAWGERGELQAVIATVKNLTSDRELLVRTNEEVERSLQILSFGAGKNLSKLPKPLPMHGRKTRYATYNLRPGESKEWVLPLERYVDSRGAFEKGAPYMIEFVPGFQYKLAGENDQAFWFNVNHKRREFERLFRFENVVVEPGSVHK